VKKIARHLEHAAEQAMAEVRIGPAEVEMKFYLDHIFHDFSNNRRDDQRHDDR